ncbi:hypothetical protein DLAC_03070 [Tieghemostelium lacteum]|uniref:Uncharacterized protein n=1 Tax=Tieghemostelium lacteum TaxID=361077 RepID=A0A152A261_TIELA|nr:hypothetical protein DLAC_03070 [Tieghemostelium lacteum]|eukprot:KYR00328.1 hypothetical protein DLAC_03070 [Tieghemostelium lacteum]
MFLFKKLFVSPNIENNNQIKEHVQVFNYIVPGIVIKSILRILINKFLNKEIKSTVYLLRISSISKKWNNEIIPTLEINYIYNLVSQNSINHFCSLVKRGFNIRFQWQFNRDQYFLKPLYNRIAIINNFEGCPRDGQSTFDYLSDSIFQQLESIEFIFNMGTKLNEFHSHSTETPGLRKSLKKLIVKSTKFSLLYAAELLAGLEECTDLTFGPNCTKIYSRSDNELANPVVNNLKHLRISKLRCSDKDLKHLTTLLPNLIELQLEDPSVITSIYSSLDPLDILKILCKPKVTYSILKLKFESRIHLVMDNLCTILSGPNSIEHLYLEPLILPSGSLSTPIVNQRLKTLVCHLYYNSFGGGNNQLEIELPKLEYLDIGYINFKITKPSPNFNTLILSKSRNQLENTCINYTLSQCNSIKKLELSEYHLNDNQGNLDIYINQHPNLEILKVGISSPSSIPVFVNILKADNRNLWKFSYNLPNLSLPDQIEELTQAIANNTNIRNLKISIQKNYSYKIVLQLITTIIEKNNTLEVLSVIYPIYPLIKKEEYQFLLDTVNNNDSPLKVIIFQKNSQFNIYRGIYYNPIKK